MATIYCTGIIFKLVFLSENHSIYILHLHYILTLVPKDQIKGSTRTRFDVKPLSGLKMA